MPARVVCAFLCLPARRRAFAAGSPRAPGPEGRASDSPAAQRRPGYATAAWAAKPRLNVRGSSPAAATSWATNAGSARSCARSAARKHTRRTSLRQPPTRCGDPAFEADIRDHRAGLNLLVTSGNDGRHRAGAVEEAILDGNIREDRLDGNNAAVVRDPVRGFVAAETLHQLDFNFGQPRRLRARTRRRGCPTPTDRRRRAVRGWLADTLTDIVAALRAGHARVAGGIRFIPPTYKCVRVPAGATSTCGGARRVQKPASSCSTPGASAAATDSELSEASSPAPGSAKPHRERRPRRFAAITSATKRTTMTPTHRGTESRLHLLALDHRADPAADSTWPVGRPDEVDRLLNAVLSRSRMIRPSRTSLPHSGMHTGQRRTAAAEMAFAKDGTSADIEPVAELLADRWTADKWVLPPGFEDKNLGLGRASTGPASSSSGSTRKAPSPVMSWTDALEIKYIDEWWAYSNNDRPTRSRGTPTAA